ncbi:MAG: AIM24 family protein [Clostridia bacterium]|nr:AIM24 family protein [Clostridia bacterium]
MAFCKNCGTDVGSASFCANCGTKVEESVATRQVNVQVNNLKDNPNIVCTDSMGCFEIYEYQRDMSVNPAMATVAYYMNEMNYRKRQVLCTLNGSAIKMQAGAMQWSAGAVTMDADVKGAKDFFGKAIKSVTTGESLSKPIYSGTGYVMLEPTYKYILFEDVSEWGSGIVLDDGMFLACDASVQEEMVKRSNISSAILGGEGLFNLSLSGNGIVALESSVPREELIEIVLDNDEVRIDGNMAVAWSKSLEFTVEKSTKSLLGSFVSGEGVVNVYRGTGKILMAPVAPGTLMSSANQPSEEGKTSSAGLVGSIANSLF